MEKTVYSCEGKKNKSHMVNNDRGLNFKAEFLATVFARVNGKLIWGRSDIHFPIYICGFGVQGWSCWTWCRPERLGWDSVRPLPLTAVTADSHLQAPSYQQPIWTFVQKESNLIPWGLQAWLTLFCKSQILLLYSPSLYSLPLAVMCLMEPSWNRMRHTQQEVPPPREGGFGEGSHCILWCR